MSRAHESAAELLEGLLRRDREGDSLTLEEIDDALESVEELSKDALGSEDEDYLDYVAETILGLRAEVLARRD